MIGEFIADEGEVEAGDFRVEGGGEICEVGHHAVEESGERIGRRIADCFAIGGHEPARVAARFEHESTATGTTGLKIEDEAHALYERVLREEGTGAEKAHFLAFGEEEDHVAPERARRFKVSGNFEHGGNACRVVRRTGGIGHCVVMRRKEQRGEIGRCAFQYSNDIMHIGRDRRPRDTRRDVDRLLGCVRFDGKAKPDKSRGYVLAHTDNVGRADGMGTCGNGLDVEHGTGGGEGHARHVAAKGCRRLRKMGGGPEAEHEHNDVRDCSGHLFVPHMPLLSEALIMRLQLRAFEQATFMQKNHAVHLTGEIEIMCGDERRHAFVAADREKFVENMS